MQERLKIQTHLTQMRQDCLRDYLQSKLESIASKEVINDILTGFVQANNQEFLESVTESILEAKESNRRLRETIEVMKRDHEMALNKQKQNVKALSKQEHYVEMSQLREELTLIKINLEAEGNQYIHKIGEITSQLQASQRAKQELSTQVEASKPKIEELATKVLQLTVEIEHCNKRLAQSDNTIQRLTSDYVQRQRKYESEVLSLKKLQLQKQVQLQAQLRSQNSSLVNKQKLHYEEIIQRLQAKTKDGESERIVNQKQIIRMSSQLQKNQLIIQQAAVKTDLIQQNLKKTELFLQDKQVQLAAVQKQLVACKQENKALLSKAESLQSSHAQFNAEQLQIITQLKETITKLENQNQLHLISQKCCQDQLERQNAEFLNTNERYQRQLQFLRRQIASKQSQRKAYEQKLGREMDANASSQEQIKNLLKYNAIQQQQASKYECELKKLEEERQAEISTYQQAFQMNMEGLQEELAASKQENSRLQEQIRGIEKQLHLQREKEKYYHSYLEEIALLKRELAKYHSQTHRSLPIRWRNSLTKQLPQRLSQLSRENRKLKETVREELRNFEQEFNKNFKLIVSAIQQNSIRCLYCQHQKQQIKKAKSPHNERTLMDRTVPRAIEKQNMASIKRNLKSIQEKYQMAYSQNQSFTNRIDSYLNSS